MKKKVSGQERGRPGAVPLMAEVKIGPWRHMGTRPYNIAAHGDKTPCPFKGILYNKKFYLINVKIHMVSFWWD